jgi:hypothetical protein
MPAYSTKMGPYFLEQVEQLDISFKQSGQKLEITLGDFPAS